jgi:hypothetical protein
LELWQPGTVPLPAILRHSLIKGYLNSLKTLRRCLNMHKVEELEDFTVVVSLPFYMILETFQLAITRFKPLSDSQEIQRALSQPLLMMPFLTEQLMSKLPASLKTLDQDNDMNNFSVYI